MPDSELASIIFGRRLQEKRRAAGWSQTDLAEAMSREGLEMSKTAVLRIENGTRELKLDEAIAFAQVLAVPFADLLEPERDGLVALHDHAATNGDGMRRWLVTGVPAAVWPEQFETRKDLELATAYLRDIALAVVSAALDRDAARRKQAEQQFSDAVRRLERAKEESDA